jgi:hypothetical protein
MGGGPAGRVSAYVRLDVAGAPIGAGGHCAEGPRWIGSSSSRSLPIPGNGMVKCRVYYIE